MMDELYGWEWFQSCSEFVNSSTKKILVNSHKKPFRRQLLIHPDGRAGTKRLSWCALIRADFVRMKDAVVSWGVVFVRCHCILRKADCSGDEPDCRIDDICLSLLKVVWRQTHRRHQLRGDWNQRKQWAGSVGFRDHNVQSRYHETNAWVGSC